MIQKADTTLPGDYAWIVLALGIAAYDTCAFFSNGKLETMSRAIWRSLSHPYKFPIAGMMWAGITWHLFFNPVARHSYKETWGYYAPGIKVIIHRKG